MNITSITRGLLAAGVLWASFGAHAIAQTYPTPVPPPVTTATPTPGPLTFDGQFRSYYFTRQNASNNPGAQYNFSSSKYSSTGVNQATWASSIGLHADYKLDTLLPGLFIGGSYFYSNPLDGPCSVASEHAKGDPCVSQAPPNTNPDDSLPGFSLSTFYEGYLGYKANGLYVKAGDQLFTSPWAGPSDTRLKPAAFQGADVAFTGVKSWTFEVADMWQYENRTANNFSNTTLITSFPAGNSGLPANIYVPGGGSIDTSGFFYGKAGYSGLPGLSVNGYFYGVSDLMNMWWGDAKYTFGASKYKPTLELQGGTEQNAGQSYLGLINSQVFGARLGVNITKNILLTAAYDGMPWHTDNVFLPKGASCSSSTYQLSTKGVTVANFLPLTNNGTAVCGNNPNGSVTLYYGGWASPYTDNYTSDPLFTTMGSQGMIERRSAGNSEKVQLTYTSDNKRITFLAAYGWLQYGNALVSNANTWEWDIDGTYRFSKWSGTGIYKGLMLRDRFFNRYIGNTYCGASSTTCPAGYAYGAEYLGGLALFKYNRAQLEYDF
ncbi:MAG TPA: OprD family outer membrane porin [Candidatus Tumulicola sp.]